jgi:mannose-6-phosphate isomerase-like protein (cupin superfamily)
MRADSLMRTTIPVRRDEVQGMTEPVRSRVIRLAETQAGIAASGERSSRILQRGTLDVALGRPTRPNEQTPHEQDEVYIVVRGRGILFHDGKRDPFESGDFLFVAAATEHRFEDFSDDLLVWRVFYGPSGGEVPA